MQFRIAAALLLCASAASAGDECGLMLRTMTHFRGTVRSAEAVPVSKTAFDPVDFDPNFVVVIDATDGRTFALGVHSLANTFGAGDAVGRTFDFDSEQLACEGAFRRLLSLEVHHASRVVEDFDGSLEVGHRYRAEVERTKEGLALTKPLVLPHHFGGGVFFVNEDEFANAKREVVFDVVSYEVRYRGKLQWSSRYEVKIVSAK